MNRPITLIGAVALNALIGMLCLVSGVLLVGAFLDGMLDRIAIDPRKALAARVFLFGLPIYGALALIGANATWRGSTRGWWLVLAVDLVGIAFLAWAISVPGPDYLKALLVTWGLAVALLILVRTQVAALRD